MKETLRLEIDVETDIDSTKGVLKEIRAKLIEVRAVKGISCATVWEFDKYRNMDIIKSEGYKMSREKGLYTHRVYY